MFQKIKSLLLYISLFFSGSFFGLFLFFPGDIVKELINREGGGFVRVGDVSLSIPPGIRLSDVFISFKGEQSNDGKRVLHIISLRISPSFFVPFTILKGVFSFSGNVVTYLGSDLDFSFSLLRERDKIFIPRKIKTSGKVSLEDIFGILGFPGFMMKGIYVSEVKLQGDVRNYENLSGGIKLYSDGFTLTLQNSPRLGLALEGEFKFGKTEADIEIRNGTIRFLNLRSNGGDVEGDVSGAIVLKKPFRQTSFDLVINLKTKISGFPSGKFKISGTVDKPSLSTM